MAQIQLLRLLGCLKNKSNSVFMPSYRTSSLFHFTKDPGVLLRILETGLILQGSLWGLCYRPVKSRGGGESSISINRQTMGLFVFDK